MTNNSSKEQPVLLIQSPVKWASVQSPKLNKFTGKKSYSVTLVLDDKNKEHQQFLARLRELDANITFRRNGSVNKKGVVNTVVEPNTTEITINANELKSDGSLAQRPQVVDRSRNAMTDLIGNGSICKTLIWYSPNTKGLPGSHNLRLGALQVLDLVPYTGTGSGVINLFSDESINDAANPNANGSRSNVSFF